MPAEHDPAHHHVGGQTECLACPICVVLQALSSTRPEVVEHLVAAGRELTLALRAVTESAAAAHAERDDAGLERIDLDGPID